MRTSDFDFELPQELIAQEPMEPRDASRLLVMDRSSGRIEHRVFSDIVEYLDEGDLLVVNDTRVLPARLIGRREGSGGAAELLLLAPQGPISADGMVQEWECLAKPGRKLREGARIVFGDGLLTAEVLALTEARGGRRVRLAASEGSLADALHAVGRAPLPPYITRDVDDPERYQTVYARSERSSAAPTAGLHFTPGLLDRVRGGGIEVATVELQVGLDTFRVVEAPDPREHVIHTERVIVGDETVEAVRRTRERGGRVIAVGTTTVRALESAWSPNRGGIEATEVDTSLFILPGYRFNVVDALVTNFHVPRSSLMMLVSAFASRESILAAYDEAIAQAYRFFSFGDAMFITDLDREGSR